MSYEDSFGFTHLVEDSDTDDNALDLSRSQLDVDLQPHLSSLETATSITGDVPYPSLTDAHDTPSEHVGNNNSKYEHFPNGGHTLNTAETCGHNSDNVDGSVGNHMSKKVVPVGHISSGPASLDSVASAPRGGEAAAAHNGSASSTSKNGVQPNIQVQFSNTKGEVKVTQQPVETRPDGTHYINTHGVPVEVSEPERPLTKKRILYLKIFSVVASVLFFPVGLWSAYFAFRIDKEFNEGIMRGNIDKAQKFAKRSERLIILALILAVVTAVLVVAIIEKPKHDDDDRHTHGVIVG